MPVFSRIFSVVLRIGEIAFATIVAGIVGDYMHDLDKANASINGRWIYTIIVAGLSILLGLIWLIPFSGGFTTWPVDIFLSLAWFASFGTLIDSLDSINCTVDFEWRGFREGDFCERWKADAAFAFLSAVFWLVSALVGLWFTYRTRDSRPVAGDAVHRRRPWYRRHHV